MYMYPIVLLLLNNTYIGALSTATPYQKMFLCVQVPSIRLQICILLLHMRMNFVRIDRKHTCQENKFY